MSPKVMHRSLAATSIPLALFLFAAARPPVERVRVGGTFTMTYSQQHPVPVADADGHVVVVNESKGTNRSTGPVQYQDGADVTLIETADLVQGNGPHQGYDIKTQNGEVTIDKWSGKVTTVLGADQKPVTSVAGTWTSVKGEVGHGTYTGHVTGPTSFTVDWEGEVDRTPVASR
jgi:hypothetical protein